MSTTKEVVFMKQMALVAAALGLSSIGWAATFQCDKTAVNPDALTKKTPVFIYVLNDQAIIPGFDAGHRNVHALFAKLVEAGSSSLPEADKAYLKKVKAILELDYEDSVAAEDAQMNQVREAGCGDGNRFRNARVILSNHSARTPLSRGEVRLQKFDVEYCKPIADGSAYTYGTVQLDWGFPNQIRTNPIIQATVAQPFLSPVNFEQAIHKIRELFPADQYQYIVWLKGHGDKNRVLRPFLELDVTNLESEKIWRRLTSNRLKGVEEDKDLSSAEIHRLSYQLRGQLEEGFPENVLGSTSKTRPFLEKVSLLKILGNAGAFNKEMKFPYVVWESDESHPERSTNPELIGVLKKGGTEKIAYPNIGLLCTLKNTVKTSTDFDSIFRPLGVEPDTSLVDHVGNVLTK